jgi:hypothetical protein
MKRSVFGSNTNGWYVWLAIASVLASFAARATVPHPDVLGSGQPAVGIADNRYVHDQGGDGDGDGVPESHNTILTPPSTPFCGNGCINIYDWTVPSLDSTFYAWGGMFFTIDIEGHGYAYSDYDWVERKSVFDITFKMIGNGPDGKGWYYSNMELSGNLGGYTGSYGGGVYTSVALYEGTTTDTTPIFEHTDYTDSYYDGGDFDTTIVLTPDTPYRLVVIGDAIGPEGEAWTDAEVIFMRGDDAPYSIGVDVKPTDPTDYVDPDVDATVAVAVLGTDRFDVNTIIPSNLTLGAAAAVQGTPVIADVNGDTYQDLTATFSVTEASILCEDTSVDITGISSKDVNLVGTGTIVTPECDSGGCHP